MNTALRVLLVEDSPTDAKLVIRALRGMDRELVSERVEDAVSLRAALGRDRWDVVLSDWAMPSFSALAALGILKEQGFDVPFIIVSGTIGEESAVEAMRAGACDYVLKDKLGRLAPAVERELRESKMRDTLRVAEEQLRQAQKMDAIGSLAGGVAHDFNNLLSVILSYSSLLIEGLRPGDPMRADLVQIHGAGERAADLTRQLLAFGRQQILRPRPLSLNDILSGTETILRRVLGEDIELTFLAGPSLGSANLDSSQVEQVIMNLVVNARDAMPTGGKLTIETANVDLDEAYAADHAGVTAGPYVVLAISDTGMGMDEATQARIFEPFFTTKEPGKGTGLGLSTVFGIVRQSGGHIWIYSELGQGTAFKVYFPRTDQVAAVLGTPEPSAPPARRVNETILLVVDDTGVRALAANILRRHGYHVLEAQNGGDALLICEQHGATLHLMLTDVVMPRMSGRQLADRLKTVRPGLRVLYMSGYTDNSIVHHGVLDSDVAFLQKPITPESLTRKVREVLDA
jgi:signal transduction histidine kinase